MLGRLAPWFGWTALASILLATWWGLAKAPPDYQQGDGFRILYVHAPSAWMSLFTYVVMALAAGIGLIWRIKLAHGAAAACAPVGASFTFLALATGSIWGKPMWGTWWVWDARLTSMFVLFLLYLGYLAVWQAIEDPHRAAMIARIVALAGFINVPIVKFSVDWWNSLHQPASVFRMGGPTIDPSMLRPLLVMGLAYLLLFISLQLVALRGEIAARKIRQLRIAEIAAK
jgi:heme exporter protein C